jgi:hypothetical protein
MPPRTIDNLGVDVSTRYAEDQKMFDEKIIKESRGIPIQAQIDVTFPSFSSELEALFEINKRNIFWADFFMPPKYREQKKRLFTYQIIPSLGSEDKKETQSQRIKDVIASRKKKMEEETDEQKKKKALPWEEEKELEEEKKEEKVLLALLEKISSLDKYLVDINSRRSQYQKG